jgi:hypothetical protein
MSTKMDKVAGVIMARAKLDLVGAALARHGLNTGGTDGAKVGRLVAYYRSATPKSRLADCSTCEGVSDVNEVACPYCGDGTVEETAPTRPVLPPVPKEVQVLVKVERNKPKTAPVVIDEKITEKDLDEAVAKVQQLKAAATESLWDLGHSIRFIHERGLWKLRREKDGSPKYKSWGAFCDAALGITQVYSYKLMDVTKAYSREQLREYGPTKLYITLTVPPEARHTILHEIERGATRAEVEQLADSVGRVRPESHRRKDMGSPSHKGSSDKIGRPAKKQDDKVTVAMLVSRVELTPTNGANNKPIMHRLPSQIIAEERLMNGVKQRIVVTNDPDGVVIIVVERVRE